MSEAILIKPVSKVSIIIRCYNEEQHIGRLLSGILQQTVKDVETIIVDSGSNNATLAIAARYPVKILSIRPEKVLLWPFAEFGLPSCPFSALKNWNSRED